jgi:hypothetical protein
MTVATGCGGGSAAHVGEHSRTLWGDVDDRDRPPDVDVDD